MSAERRTTVGFVAGCVLDTLLALGGLTGSPAGTLLLVLVAIAAVVLVGRLVLRVAWKLVVVATVLVAGFWAVTTLLAGF